MDTHTLSNHRRPRWRFTVIIALMAALAPFSTATYLPSFPDIIAELLIGLSFGIWWFSLPRPKG